MLEGRKWSGSRYITARCQGQGCQPCRMAALAALAYGRHMASYLRALYRDAWSTAAMTTHAPQPPVFFNTCWFVPAILELSAAAEMHGELQCGSYSTCAHYPAAAMTSHDQPRTTTSIFFNTCWFVTPAVWCILHMLCGAHGVCSLLGLHVCGADISICGPGISWSRSRSGSL